MESHYTTGTDRPSIEETQRTSFTRRLHSGVRVVREAMLSSGGDSPFEIYFCDLSTIRGRKYSMLNFLRKFLVMSFVESMTWKSHM